MGCILGSATERRQKAVREWACGWHYAWVEWNEDSNC